MACWAPIAAGCKRSAGGVGYGGVPMVRAGSSTGPGRFSGSRFSGRGKGGNKVMGAIEPALTTGTGP
eukprot:6572227-Karenia_brevis.AAC.1